jgi:transcriptional regulator with XRE-family HTH domain
MSTFGKKLREARETKGLSQQELAKSIGTIHTVVGRYERDEMKPSIDVVKRLAEELDTTVGYLIDEAKEANLLKDPAMLMRFQEIDQLNNHDKECVFTFLDAFIAKNKTI